MSIKVSLRGRQTPPFLVMDVLERAKEKEAAGEDVIHLEVGEPDFETPEVIREAAIEAIRSGLTRYTHSQGLLELREAIVEYYRSQYGVSFSPDQVVVTSGSSPAILLALSALLDPGDEIILTNPYYACYPNFVRVLEGEPVFVPLSGKTGFQIDPDRVAAAVSKRTKAVFINSPANPTGAVASEETLKALAGLEVPIVSDEIYHELVYGPRARSILEFTDQALVVNGFSKRYAMTGWRLGFLILPPELVRPVQKLQQNLFIAANAFVQMAGITALEKGGPSVEAMRQTFDARRRILLDGLRSLGFPVEVEPAGAFYILTRADHLNPDSRRLASDILEKTNVAVTPGIDFGSEAEGHLRFSYATGEKRIREGIRRLGEALDSLRADPPGR